MHKSLKPQIKCYTESGDVIVEGILTQRACANIVVEIIKLLSHQKLQIPYKYELLQYAVHKKKNADKDKPDTNWQSQKNFHTVTAALNVLDKIFKNLILEMESAEPPEEVYIVLGSTPTSPKEVFRINLPENLHLHYHHNHSQTSTNVVLNTLRKITTSSSFSKTIYHPIQPTSMYFLLSRKRKPNNALNGDKRAFSEFFHPVHNLKISPKVTQTVINLKYFVPLDVNCCNQMVIFQDFSLKCNIDGVIHIKSDNDNSNSDKVDLKNDTSDCSVNNDQINDTVSIKDDEDATLLTAENDDLIVSCVNVENNINNVKTIDTNAIDSIKTDIINNESSQISKDKDCSSNFNLGNDNLNPESDNAGISSSSDNASRRNDDISIHNDDASKHNDNVSKRNDDTSRYNDNMSRHYDNVHQHNEDVHQHNDDVHQHNEDVHQHNDDVSQHSDNVSQQNDAVDNVHILTECKVSDDPSVMVNGCERNVTRDLSLENEERNWYQASLVFKGFKDCFVRGDSITMSWLS